MMSSLRLHVLPFAATIVVLVGLLSGCSSARFIPEGEAILSSVRLETDSRQVSARTLRPYVRQEANARWFNLVKVPLGIYCLQAADTTKRWSRFIRRLGEAPVIYSEEMMEMSKQNIANALMNKGFYHATVAADTLRRGRKMRVTYRVHPGLSNYVATLASEFDNEEVEAIVRAKESETLLHKGMQLDASVLSEERSRILNLLRNEGFYNINKEFVSFRADTARADYGVDLTLIVQRPANVDSARAYARYRLRDVAVREDVAQDEAADSSEYRRLKFFFNGRNKLYRRVYANSIYLHPDSLYRLRDMQASYTGLNSLPVVGYSAIRFRDVSPAQTDSALLDADISVNLRKPNSIGAEAEGTNTAGNFGAAVALTYSNQNIFRGAETFSLKLRGAYEAITGLEGYDAQNYLEYNIETSLRFPRLLIPGLSRRTRQDLSASSEVSLTYNSQNRPEFHRRVLTGSWTYRWKNKKAAAWQHRLDLLSLNYVFMPWISSTFREEYLNGTDSRYAVLRYSYEDLFIMKLGYSFTYNSLRSTSPRGLYQTNGYQVRFNIETAGNLLYGLSHLFHASKGDDGQYRLFNIAYSQYAKVDIDFAKSFVVNDNNSFAIHAAFGLALPYGNSSILPYEKRYFAGGANSVRGWSVRELGPGSYVGKDGKIDFINQTGNMKLDLSVEFRTQLLGKLHGAAFIDAGNIWNTRNYADQPGGQFKFNKFYKQIAASYGLGLRYDLGYFILRLDGGMKAINPAVESGSGHWPLLHPRFSRDFTLHFAIGLPF